MIKPKIEKLTHDDLSKDGFPIFKFYAENENLRGLVRSDEMVIPTGQGWYCEDKEIAGEVERRVDAIFTLTRTGSELQKDYQAVFGDYPQYYMDIMGIDLAEPMEKMVLEVFKSAKKPELLKRQVAGSAFLPLEDKLIVFRNDNLFNARRNEQVNQCLAGLDVGTPSDCKKAQENLKREYEAGALSPDFSIGGKAYEVFKKEMADSLIPAIKARPAALEESSGREVADKIVAKRSQEGALNPPHASIPVFDYKGVRLY